MTVFKLALLTFQIVIKIANSQEPYPECANIGCVHASAKLLLRINSDINPCNDFYKFACGTFLSNSYVADERININTDSIMNDQLDEHLYRIFSKPAEASEPKPHKLAKNIYEKCMDLDRIKNIGITELLKLLDYLGGWPLLEGTNWNESQWSWEQTLFKLHHFVGIVNGQNMFRENLNALPAGNIQGIIADIEKEQKTVKEYPNYMLEIALALGAKNTEDIRRELSEASEFGTAIVQLLNAKNYPEKGISKKEYRNLKSAMNVIKWLETFDRFKLKSVESPYVSKKLSVHENFRNLKQKFKPRTIANYVMWRIIEFSSEFLHDDRFGKAFRYYKETYGIIDKEQRWKLCTRLTKKYAELASGSLYIRDYFPPETRQAAFEMVKWIVAEFKDSIAKSVLIDEEAKQMTLERVNEIKIYIGYDEKLLNVSEVEGYYGKLSKDFSDSFFYSALQLNVHNTDTAFEYKYLKLSTNSWIEYAKPTTLRATYNHKDNSIYFAAAILQPPNYDKDRPNSMNFGAIGSVIAHELTHSFDRIAGYIRQKRGDGPIAHYIDMLNCIIEQYSEFKDEDLNINPSGIITVTEDTADNGGVALAYRAYQKWHESVKQKQSSLIALKFTPQQLFWISYAQFYCTVQRNQYKRHIVDIKDPHSFDYFRVTGPLLNSNDFSNDFNCPLNSNMNINRTKCKVW